MLFFNYITLPLKQLIRIKIAFFFTIIFPVILFLVYGHDNLVSMISFFNFTMQSAMLQSVGIFVSAQKNTSWGQYVSTLPAPYLYPIMGIIIAMFMIGVCGLIMICSIDIFIYHILSYSQLTLVLFAAALGSIPMGALGYLIGVGFDQASARNILTFINIIFLFMTFVPYEIQKLLAYFVLPNVWLRFSSMLVMDKSFHLYSFFILCVYFVIFIILVKLIDIPKNIFVS